MPSENEQIVKALLNFSSGNPSLKLIEDNFKNLAKEYCFILGEKGDLIYQYITCLFTNLHQLNGVQYILSYNDISNFLVFIFDYYMPSSLILTTTTNKMKEEDNLDAKQKLNFIIVNFFKCDEKFIKFFISNHTLILLKILLYLQEYSFIETFRTHVNDEFYLKHLIVLRQILIKSKIIKTYCSYLISQFIAYSNHGIFTLKSIVLKDEKDINDQNIQKISYTSKMILHPVGIEKGKLDNYYENVIKQIFEQLKQRQPIGLELYYILHLLDLLWSSTPCSTPEVRHILQLKIEESNLSLLGSNSNLQELLLKHYYESNNLFYVLEPVILRDFKKIFYENHLKDVVPLEFSKITLWISKCTNNVITYFLDKVLLDVFPILIYEENYDLIIANITNIMKQLLRDINNFDILLLLFESLSQTLIVENDFSHAAQKENLIPRLLLNLSLLQIYLEVEIDLKGGQLRTILVGLTRLIDQYDIFANRSSKVKSQTFCKILQSMIVIVSGEKINLEVDILENLSESVRLAILKTNGGGTQDQTCVNHYQAPNLQIAVKSHLIMLQRAVTLKIQNLKKMAPDVGNGKNGSPTDIWSQWWRDVSSELVPVKAQAYLRLLKQLNTRQNDISWLTEFNEYFIENANDILEIVLQDLNHSDSYVYLAVMKFVKEIFTLSALLTQTNSSALTAGCGYGGDLILNKLLEPFENYCINSSRPCENGAKTTLAQHPPGEEDNINFFTKINECLTIIADKTLLDCCSDPNNNNNNSILLPIIVTVLNRLGALLITIYGNQEIFHKDADKEGGDINEGEDYYYYSANVQALQSSLIFTLASWIAIISPELASLKTNHKISVKSVLEMIDKILLTCSKSYNTSFQLLNAIFTYYRSLVSKCHSFTMTADKDGGYFEDITVREILKSIDSACRTFLQNVKMISKTGKFSSNNEEDLISHCVELLRLLDDLRNNS